MSKSAKLRWEGLTAAELAERWSREVVELREVVDSTNDVAKKLAEGGVPDGSVVLAGRQKKGRGRAGRSWFSPRDRGVYLSMVFHPRDLSHPAPLSIQAGLGIAENLERLFPGFRPMLKWPNDLIAGDRKFGGILAEAAWSDAAPRYLVVGVGVNVRPIRKDAPDDVRARGTAIDSQLGATTPLVAVADAVVRGLDEALGHPEPVLTPSVLDRVDRHDWLRDRRATVALPGDAEPISGVCVGIAPDGALLFRPDRGALRRIPSGTVTAE
ncbi:MAG: biotin--[acetyl-CoA-carboxylase] ligase [Gemmatimonadota bacterium]